MSRFLVRDQVQAAIFDGSTNYLELTGYAPSILNLTVAFWIFVQAVTANTRILDWQDAGPANGFTIQYASTPKFNAVSRAAGVVDSDLGSKYLGLGRWRHLVYCYAPNDARLYVDNELVAPQDTINGMTLAAATPRIGARTTGATNIAKFYMADFFMLNRALTAAEVEVLYRANEAPSGTIDVSLPFNGNLTDNSTNNRTFTQGGTIAFTDYVRHSARIAS